MSNMWTTILTTTAAALAEVVQSDAELVGPTRG